MEEEGMARRLDRLEVRVDNLERAYQKVERDLQDLVRQQSTMQATMSDRFEEMKEQIQGVVTGALNSLPPWGAKLFGLTTALVASLTTAIVLLIVAYLQKP